MNRSTTNSEETLARVSELARLALQAQANAAKQSIEIGRATLASEVDPQAAGRAWVEAVGREGARYWQDVGALGVEVAGQLLALSTRGMARVLSETQAAVQQSRATSRPTGRTATPWPEAGHDERGGDEATPVVAAEDGQVRHVAVTLHGAVGETASGTVLLANQHPRARRVLLTPGDLRRRSGAGGSLAMRVAPEGVTIPANGEQTVTVEVDLPADTVASGERCTGTIAVTGGVEAVVDVTVEVG